MDLTQYIDAFVAAPIAMILLVYIYLSNRSSNSFTTKIIEQQNKIIEQYGNIISETVKIIKQQERNQ